MTKSPRQTQAETANYEVGLDRWWRSRCDGPIATGNGRWNDINGGKPQVNQAAWQQSEQIINNASKNEWNRFG